MVHCSLLDPMNHEPLVKKVINDFLSFLDRNYLCSFSKADRNFSSPNRILVLTVPRDLPV